MADVTVDAPVEELDEEEDVLVEEGEIAGDYLEQLLDVCERVVVTVRLGVAPLEVAPPAIREVRGRAMRASKGEEAIAEAGLAVENAH